MYPLRFQPIFRHYLWGGRRLASELGKQTGDTDCAESWEIVDRADDNSIVSDGELAGRSLHELIADQGNELLGAAVWQQINQENWPENLRGRFPLLLKFLDANKTLSVQVHPDDAAGLQKEVPDLGKTEAWYVLDAAPGSIIYAGLIEGVDREALAQAVESKTTDQVLHQIQPRRGDCIFIPAGTVHAIGAGLLIAEIQQSSDTTYRLFDWNRVDDQGNSRPLHIEQALDVTDYGRGPVSVQAAVRSAEPDVSELVRCDKFVMRRWKLSTGSRELTTGGSFRILACVEGQTRIDGDPCGRPLRRGQSMLVPACMEAVQLHTEDQCELLEIGVPAG